MAGASRPRRLALGAAKLVFAVLLVELLLRGVLAVSPVELVYLNYRTAPWHVDDHPHWGVWHQPEVVTTHVKSCLEVTYTTNRFGMRDKPRELARSGPRVAVLGDSFVEGYVVGDDEVFTRVLEDELHAGGAEFLNFGTSGFFGTTQEWLVYQHLAREFRPDLVILAFLNENDLFDNSWSRWEGSDRRRPYLLERDDGSFDLFYPEVEGTRHGFGAALSNALMRFSYLARVANELSLQLRYRDEQPRALEVYAEQPDPEMAAAWRVTEEALRRLRDAVQADGAELLVVQLAEPAQLDPAQAERIAAVPGHDVLAPNRRLAEITGRLGVDYLSLYEPFVAYRDAHDLGPPYFALTCDRHWSALGHRVAAEAIAEHLERSGLLSTAGR